MASPKVTELISLIKSAQKTTEIYVPSVGKKVGFKHLTAGQQEKFVQAMIDNPALQPKFNSTLIEVIKENCEDKSLITQFTVLDKYAIAIGLRVASIGKNLKAEVDTEPGIVYNIDLTAVLDKIQTIKQPILKDIEIGDVKLEIQYPTISLEHLHDKFFKREDASIEVTADNLRSFISNAFISDVIMFIKVLSYNRVNGDPLVLDFNQLQIQDKLDIVRRLPSDVIEAMLTPMSVVKGLIEQVLQATGTAEGDTKINRGILITFDSSLFIVAS